MIVKRVYEDTLAQASYLIGCGRTHTAIVIDANRDVEQYVRLADSEGLRITHVTETHIHADFVSGSRELAERTGATLCLSDEGDASWKYESAAAEGATLLHHGDVLEVGDVALGVLHTPGHTPEHLSFVVTDTAAADAPIAMLTGDFVFVGDVGRPDLLEKAAGVSGSMTQAARTLYASLQAFAQYPDWMQVWPGHGAGSACGKGLSAVPHSTIGYERRFNWAFGVADEAEFVRLVLDGQPEPPRYFAEMKRINKAGPSLLHGIRPPGRLPLARLAAVLESRAMVVDTRPAAAYAEGHMPGTISIPLNRSFTTWAGWFLPFDADFYLIIDDTSPYRAHEAARDLAMIGLDRIAGYFPAAVVDECKARGETLETVAQLTSSTLAERIAAGRVELLDVRGRSEWDAGHLPGATNIPVGHLVGRVAEVPADIPVAVYCQGGARSAIAASILQAAGRTNVVNLTGGFAEWRANGHRVERSA